MMSVIMKMIMGLGVRLLTEKFLEELLLLGLKKLSESTKTKIDDEIFSIVEKHIKGK